jgi:hypothetical protein
MFDADVGNSVVGNICYINTFIVVVCCCLSFFSLFVCLGTDFNREKLLMLTKRSSAIGVPSQHHRHRAMEDDKVKTCTLAERMVCLTSYFLDIVERIAPINVTKISP